MAIDPEARAQAGRAEQKIDSHEDRCSERWGEAREEMKLLHKRISETKESLERKIDAGNKRITNWLIGGQASLILALIGGILAVVFK